MIRWADPFLLHLIALFPALLLAALLLWRRRRRDAADALGDAELVERLGGRGLRRFPYRRAALLLPAGALLGLSAAGPRWGSSGPGAPPRHGDVVLVLDASNSMLVEDVLPNRLEREREAAGELLRRLRGSRVALVVFAGSGYVLSPLTSDFAALHLFVDALSPDIVHQSGSSLYAALRDAMTLLPASEAGGSPGAIVLVSDGEALEPGTLLADELRRAARRGIAVHTVGIGTAAGGPVPEVDWGTGRRHGYKREMDGGVAVSRRVDGNLTEIARLTGGTFTAQADARSLAALAAAAQRGGRSTAPEAASAPDNRYEWFLALALLLLAADALSERPLRVQRRVAG